jgi:uncharacterized protein YcbX
MGKVEAIYRYPVKGLSAEALTRVALTPGEGVPLDRAFALALGTTRFDPAKPEFMPKAFFLMLMRDEKLAALATRYDSETATLEIMRSGKRVAAGRLDQPAGRAVIEQFFAAYVGAAARGTPKVVQAPGHAFTDVPEKTVTLINMASVADLARVVGRPVDPLRFRANLVVEGLKPWAEKAWVGREIAIGGARFRVTGQIDRCAATNVEPGTGERDMTLPKTLMSAFGGNLFGVYLEVIEGGEVALGDALNGV